MLQLPIEEFKLKFVTLDLPECEVLLKEARERFDALDDEAKQLFVKDCLETILCFTMQKGLGPDEINLIVNILVTPRVQYEELVKRNLQ